MPQEKLMKIKEVAGNLFIRSGYQHTQIRDIAKAAGISVGGVYLLFTCKKAVLDFVLKCDMDARHLEKEMQFPISETSFSTLQNEVMVTLYKSGIKFAAPLTEPNRAYPFEQLLADVFDLYTQYGVSWLILETDPNGFGRLGAFYAQYKQRFFDTFLRFIGRYEENGELRPLLQTDQCARLMLETLEFWSARVKYVTAIRDIPPAEERKNICLDALLCAFRAAE